MKRIKYLTQAEVDKRAKYHVATIGSCFAPTKRICGTITTNAYGNKLNTALMRAEAVTTPRIERRIKS